MTELPTVKLEEADLRAVTSANQPPLMTILGDGTDTAATSAEVQRIMVEALPSVSARNVPDLHRSFIDSTERIARVWRAGTNPYEAGPVDTAYAVVAAWARAMPLWYLGDDVMTLMEHAASTMPTQVLYDEDLPSPTGFLMFSRPLTLPLSFAEAHGGCPIHGLVWFPGVSQEGEPALNVGAVHAGSSLCGFLTLRSWVLGREDTYQSPATPITRSWLLATFALLTQERLLDMTSMGPDRAQRRRAQRKGDAAPSVRVVSLNGPTGGTHAGGEHGGYSHRWIVSGHWRNQWMPKREMHRLQWIAPHVKGPKEKPLVVKDTVRSLTRP